METNISDELKQVMLIVLKERFEKNMHRHRDIEWSEVCAKLESQEKALRSVFLMENSGGEPDVVGRDPESGKYIFYDCSPETPRGRRYTCYDRAALEARKKNKPEQNAMDMASSMGIEILSEDEYRELQKLGEFDLKTSSWIHTPEKIRALGGALFCDRRYDTVFVYHNGAESYYSGRGFRGKLLV